MQGVELGKLPVAFACFCPQSKPLTADQIDAFRALVRQNQLLKPLLHDISNLWDVYEILVRQRPEFASLRRIRDYTRAFASWAHDGSSTPVAEATTAIILLPFLTLLHVTQYFQYLDHRSIRHADFLEELSAGSGVHGYCGGMFTAFSIACARDEREVVDFAAASLRIGYAMACYSELGDDSTVPGCTSLILRLRRVGQGEEILAQHPRACMGGYIDPTTMSVNGPPETMADIAAFATGQSIPVHELPHRGKFHNPENASLVHELLSLCDHEPLLSFPSASQLRVKSRSNVDGEIVTEGSLVQQVVRLMLSQPCAWNTLVAKLADELHQSGGLKAHAVTFGVGDCLSTPVFTQKAVKLSKFDAHSLMAKVQIPRPINSSQHSSQPIAIVGVACRVPGANSLDELWSMLEQGQDQHKQVPTDRFNLPAGFRASQQCGSFAAHRKFYGNFLDDVAHFDHSFFNSNPREASSMDPQQRILLEVAYEAMESSGYSKTHDRLKGDRVGCFVGCSVAEYLENTTAHPPTTYTSTGTIRSFLSGRISYFFGWTGPSEVIDTACSSSLVAVHRACKAINTGECHMALAGGVNIITGGHNFLDLGKAGFLSPSGQCKPFSADADGYCRSEGAALVVLKRLDEATRNHDQILGVIPGIATNQGGLSSALTLPHAETQVSLYQSVLGQAGLDPDQISYFEAHGTGTKAGDPVEMESIRNVFGGGSRTESLQIGSVKGNVGHCETAAGAVGLAKVLSMLFRLGIPPQASFKSLNPKIAPLEPNKMAISTRAQRWTGTRRAAFVSSYGASGSNCALICQEGNNNISRSRNASEHSYPIILSAASAKSLSAYREALAAYIARPDIDVSLADIAFTLSQRRKLFSSGVIMQKNSVQELTRSLRTDTDLEPFNLDRDADNAILVIGGQSDQVVGLDKKIYDAFPRFRQYIDVCVEAFAGLGAKGSSLLQGIFSKDPIADPCILQVGLMAVQWANARCWIDAGVQIKAVVGHSFGELTGLAVTGILSIEDCIKLVVKRAELLKTRINGDTGAMVAVHADVSTTRAVIEAVRQDGNGLEIACYNGPTLQTLAGRTSEVDEALRSIEKHAQFSSIKVQRMNTSHAFHSKIVEPIVPGLQAIAQELDWREPQIPLEMCSAPGGHAGRYNPCEHARKPVFFGDAVQRLEAKYGRCAWLEAGFNGYVTSLAKKASKDPDKHSVIRFRMSDNLDAVDVMSDLTKQLFRTGNAVAHWSFLDAHLSDIHQTWLPPYQFEKIRHWLDNVDRVIEMQNTAKRAEPQEPSTPAPPKPPPPPMLVNLVESANAASGASRFDVNTASKRYREIVSGHAIRGRPMVPATLYTECVANACHTLLGGLNDGELEFKNITFPHPLGLDSDAVSLSMHSTGVPTTWKFEFESTRATKKISHAHGTVQVLAPIDTGAVSRLVKDNVESLKVKKGVERMYTKRCYSAFAPAVIYGDFFRGIEEMLVDGRQAVATIKLPSSQPHRSESTTIRRCDCPTLDSFIQVVGLIINTSDEVPPSDLMVGASMDRISVSPKCDMESGGPFTVYASFRWSTPALQEAVGDIFVFSADQELVTTALGCRFTRIAAVKLERALDAAASKASATMSTSKPKEIPNGISAPPPRPTPAYEIPAKAPSQANGVAHDSGPAQNVVSKPNAPPAELVKQLKEIIASYLGMEATAVPDSVDFQSLGLDSLATGELSEQLLSSYDVTIDSQDLEGLNLTTLVERCAHSPRVATEQSRPLTNGVQAPNGIPEVNGAPAPNGVPPMPKDMSNGTLHVEEPISQEPAATNGQADRSGEILALVAEFAGMQPSEIRRDSSMADLGLDSLAMVELQGTFEEISGTPLPDSTELTEITINDLISILSPKAVNGSAPATKSKQDNMAPAPPVTAPFVVLKNAGTCANPLPKGLRSALDESNDAFTPLARQRGLQGYCSGPLLLLDELSLSYLHEALQKLGIELGSIPSGAPMSGLPVHAKYVKLQYRFFEMLEKHGLLSRRDGVWARTHKQFAPRPSGVLHAEFISRFSHLANEAELLSITGSRLADCLKGTANPLNLLFGSAKGASCMADVYRTAPVVSVPTSQLSVLLQRALSEEPLRSKKPVRILEVGAGTGGTTAEVAKMIEALGVPVEYTFSDLSTSLLQKSKVQFGQYKWMKHEVFDLEKPVPAASRGKYDIIIGTNVVHATTDRPAVLRTVNEALDESGFVALLECTRVIDYWDMVYGLLDGWWFAEHGTAYPLQPAEVWMQYFAKAGFKAASYSTGSAPEANMVRLLVASKVSAASPAGPAPVPTFRRWSIQTRAYKVVDGVPLEADVYVPRDPPPHKMPIVLLIHGGGFMSLSKKAIRPHQLKHLIASGVLPVSINFRLCPQASLRDGCMADVRDAYAWAAQHLPADLAASGIHVDGSRIAAVGWSTGGHLAATLGWTAAHANLPPPRAILAFYAPLDLHLPAWDAPRGAALPEPSTPLDAALDLLPDAAVAEARGSSADTSDLGMLAPGDPRSDVILHTIKHTAGLASVLHALPARAPGVPTAARRAAWLRAPEPATVAACCPAEVARAGRFGAPAFAVHGAQDEIAPVEGARAFVAALREGGGACGLLELPGVGHFHDLLVAPGTAAWDEQVGPGYDFLMAHLRGDRHVV